MNLSRYELKFTLDESAYARALSWLYTCTGARTAHAPRIVNSVYFDDPGYSSVRDNLAGISSRRKTRLRWYHYDEGRKPCDTALEIKHRDGRLGRKEKFDLPGLEESLLNLEYRDLFSQVEKRIPSHSAFCVTEHFSPTLHVSYTRQYFEGQGGVRVTFDRPVTFYATLPHTRPFDNIAIPYRSTVMEIKFPVERKDAVAASLRHLNMTPKRHSKYLAGLAAFGYTVYL